MNLDQQNPSPSNPFSMNDDNSSKSKKFDLSQKGQGLIEYLLIVALVAIATISAIQFLGQNVRHKLTQISGELGGGVRGLQRAPQMERGMTSRQDMKTLFNND
jgi:pilus assembly protein Flp/PilA